MSSEKSPSLYDIIEKDGEKHVIIKIVKGIGATVETMPLDELLKKDRFMLVDGKIAILRYKL